MLECRTLQNMSQRFILRVSCEKSMHFYSGHNDLYQCTLTVYTLVKFFRFTMSTLVFKPYFFKSAWSHVKGLWINSTMNNLH
jgi:hypothetical protein